MHISQKNLIYLLGDLNVKERQVQFAMSYVNIAHGKIFTTHEQADIFIEQNKDELCLLPKYK